jgi:hypothetical protein
MRESWPLPSGITMLASVALAAGLALAPAGVGFAQTPGESVTAPPPPAPESTAAPPAAKKPARTKHHIVVESDEVEPAHAKVKLKEDAKVYSRPAKSSKVIARVHADKFVNVTGSTHYYLRVQLKDGQVGYLSPSAVELVRPTDKVFTLTSDSPVYDRPNRWGKKLSEVHRGHSIHVIGIALEYLKIKMKDGTEGFVPTVALQ